MGLHRAGFEVTGVDWTGQPAYPFKLKVERVERLSPDYLREFDLIWASPPCQKWSIVTKTNGRNDDHPDLIPLTRALLKTAGVPSIIENVPQSPLRADVLLCGSMFGLRLVRHRIFEVSGFTVNQPDHRDHHWKYVTVAGTPGHSRSGPHGYGRLSEWQEAMGIDWMPSRALAQAVPPAYSEYLAKEYVRGAHLRADREPVFRP